MYRKGTPSFSSKKGREEKRTGKGSRSFTQWKAIREEEYLRVYGEKRPADAANGKRKRSRDLRPIHPRLNNHKGGGRGGGKISNHLSGNRPR